MIEAIWKNPMVFLLVFQCYGDQWHIWSTFAHLVAFRSQLPILVQCSQLCIQLYWYVWRLFWHHSRNIFCNLTSSVADLGFSSVFLVFSALTGPRDYIDLFLNYQHFAFEILLKKERCQMKRFELSRFFSMKRSNLKHFRDRWNSTMSEDSLHAENRFDQLSRIWKNWQKLKFLSAGKFIACVLTLSESID